MAIPRAGVASTSARTSSIVSSGRSAETIVATGSSTTSCIAAASASFQGRPRSSQRGTPFSSSGSADTTVTGPTSAPETAASTISSSSRISPARSSGESLAASRLLAASSRLTGTRTWALPGELDRRASIAATYAPAVLAKEEAHALVELPAGSCSGLRDGCVVR